MRRSNTSRRTNRSVVPSRSAACSTVNSVSNSGLLVLRRSCSSRCSRGGQLLPGNPSPFTGTGSGRQGQPALALGLVTLAGIGPGGDDDHGLVVLGPAPGIQGNAVAGSAALGEGDPGAAQDREGGRVAPALGRPMAAESEHVRPDPQPQTL